MPNRLKVIVTMPAYNAARTLEKTLQDIPRDMVDQILLVDDASTDETLEVAARLGIETVRHERNRGYGGNQKTCYDTALARGADVVILLHPDYQYDPKMIGDLVAPILEGRADFTFGSRFLHGWTAPLKGGMPFYRWVGNRLTTMVENIALGTAFTELHSGYKAYSRSVLENIPYHEYSEAFEFDSQMLIDAIYSKRFRIEEVAIPTRYRQDSSSASIASSLRYIALTLWFLGRVRFQQRRQEREAAHQAH